MNSEPASATSDARLAPLDLVRILRQRWMLVVVCTVAGLGAALGLSLRADERYTASSELLLRDPGFARTLFGSDVFEAGVDPQRDTSTKVAVISSPDVAARVVERLKLTQSGSQVQSWVDVTPKENSDVVVIAAETPDPQLSADVANAVASEYIVYQRELDRTKVSDAKSFVEENLATADTAAEREGLLDSLKQLTVLEALQTGNADVVAQAGPPGDPSSPKTKRNAIVGGVLGLLLGMGLALLADFLDRRLKSVEDFERAFGHPVLVTIPARAVPRRDEFEGPQSEPYRMLRESLRFLDAVGAHRCILVTSPDAGEGKTTVAVNLTRAFSAAGARALLVEADLRRPAVAKQVGIEPGGQGLTSALVTDARLTDLIRDVGMDEWVYKVVPTGESPPNPADLLRTRRMKRLLGEARDLADIVIVDAAPLVPVSDTHALLDLQEIDGVLVVGRAYSTTRDRAARARRVLVGSGRSVLGVVMTNDRQSGEARYYSAYNPRPPLLRPRRGMSARD